MNAELKKKLTEDVVAGNPFSQYIGMEVLEVREGYALGRIHFEDRHKNVYGGMHGGCAYALADTIGGIAALTYGYDVTTVNSSMNYLSPIKDTQYVYCEAQVVRHGRRISVFDVRVMNDEKQVLTDGSFTYYSMDKKKSKE